MPAMRTRTMPTKLMCLDRSVGVSIKRQPHEASNQPHKLNLLQTKISSRFRQSAATDKGAQKCQRGRARSVISLEVEVQGGKGKRQRQWKDGKIWGLSGRFETQSSKGYLEQNIAQGTTGHQLMHANCNQFWPTKNPLLAKVKYEPSF